MTRVTIVSEQGDIHKITAYAIRIGSGALQ